MTDIISGANGAVQRFADGYREMPDEKLADLLATADSLNEDARAALERVIAERTNAGAIREKAAAMKQARTAEENPATRPSLGFWLGFLIFGFVMAPLRSCGDIHNQITTTEQQYPGLLEMGSWQSYKVVSYVLSFTVLIASIIGINAILKGTSSHDRDKVIGAIWYIGIGITLVDFVTSVLLFGSDVLQGYLDGATIGQLIAMIFVATLWTLYLTTSKRCRQRYPARSDG